jgi:predicted MPP superfamily phosphohydrolase
MLEILLQNSLIKLSILRKNIQSFKLWFVLLSLLLVYSCRQTDVATSSKVPESVQSSDTTQITQLVFTADLHYGITRAFRGVAVDANIVNEAMVKQINALPTAVFPSDEGINAGKKIGFIDYVAIGGDITNRQQSGIQSATASWAQFNADYLNGITLKNKQNMNTDFLLICGNHDVSNAIGFYKALSPAIDNSSMVNIYNLMLKPTTPKTSSTYNYATDKPNYSKDVVGVHMMFITMWPDSANCVWMEKKLSTVNASTPVIIFSHDPVAGESTHFTNPFGDHGLTADYENEIDEKYKGMLSLQKEFAAFLKRHANIKAYFHGHTNYNEYYTFVGPDGDVNLHVYRVDSPMKGSASGSDETKLSFQVISINGKSKTMTVRECLWNTSSINSPIVWGNTSTISL